ncbi:ABC transporter permease [Bacillus sp. OK048]|uniref:ABC transporter permease n=1 Tax=Bacillus sp. OK048 TaxID=1882761 RepID=UPI000890269E|nr:ABC transporter permease [Bacillus sp. OK048]SDN57977.1 ABC-2 type transport system permease protein [Bacillus sp. OK048]
MGRIWSICTFEIARVYQKPSSYILMFVMPLIFTFLFAGVGGNNAATSFKIALVDQDKTAISQELVKKMEQEEWLDIKLIELSKAEKQLSNKSISGMITIPSGFAEQFFNGEKPEVAFRHGPDLGIAGSIRHMIDNAMAQESIKVKAAHLVSPNSTGAELTASYQSMSAALGTDLITVDAKNISTSSSLNRSNNQSERLVGFVILFLMITLTIVTGKILEARKIGVWYRLLSTPSSRFNIMGGYMLSFLIIGWLQIAILMIASHFIFGTVWGNLLAQFCLISALLLCAIGLGLMVAGFVKTAEQQMLMGIIIISPTCMLGGVYWPIELVPDFMQKIALFVPQYWAMEGFKTVMAHGGTLLDVLGSVGILLGFAAVFMAVGISRVRYE